MQKSSEEDVRLLLSCRNSTQERTLTVLLGTFEGPHRFFVGNYAGTELADVISLLTNARINEVVVEFDDSFPAGASERVCKLLEAAQIKIAGLWPPTETNAVNMHAREVFGSINVNATVLMGSIASRGRIFVGLRVPAKLENAIKLVKCVNVQKIAFESDFKFSTEAVEHYIRSFETAGLEVSEFWVPSSTIKGGLVNKVEKQR